MFLHKIVKKFLIIILIAIFCFSCGFPSEEQVKKEFKLANPTYEPTSAVVGEGHGDAAYYHIEYKKPNDNKTYEQIWLYMRSDDGKIKFYGKEKETIVE